MTYRVTVWVERVQVEYLASKYCESYEEAIDWAKKDFETRRNDAQFLKNGGYEIEQQVWKTCGNLRIETSPTLVAY